MRRLLSGLGLLPAVKPASSGAAFDTVLVLDGSGSMTDTDWKPSRLRAAQEAAIAFVDERGGSAPDSSVAVVAFSDGASVSCGLTRVTQRVALCRAVTTGCTAGGTDMAAGLEAAERILGRRPHTQVVLLTDGHNGGASPLPIAERLKRRGCEIHTVGIGGSPAAVDEALLKQIASLDASGRPLYRFIGDRQRLVEHFRDLGGGLTR